MSLFCIQNEWTKFHAWFDAARFAEITQVSPAADYVDQSVVEEDVRRIDDSHATSHDLHGRQAAVV